MSAPGPQLPSARIYADRVAAVAAQRARWKRRDGPDRWSRRAAAFRLDPRREMDPNLAAFAQLVGPEDTLLDVGGGAGRVSLPVALRCRAVTNVDPSPGMREQFEASAAEASITNARAVPGEWPAAAPGLEADVVCTFNVTYFVREIVAFIEALQAGARKRVVIGTWSVPPPDHPAALYELLHGEPLERTPTHRELLPVLWDLGILPDLRVLPQPFRGLRSQPPTRDDALTLALQSVDAEDDADARALFEQHFDKLFAPGPNGGFEPRWTPETREMLITWAPAR